MHKKNIKNIVRLNFCLLIFLVDELKEAKSNERSNRLIIKGRKVMEHGHINKGKKKKEKLEKDENEEDEKYMLYYEDI